ncbi:MAG: FAD-dependent oxidoreductase, partial [Pseudomonadota bacterium]
EKVKKIQLLTGDILEAEQVLWAIGRKPLTDGLGLTRIGVELDKSGAVIVDDDYQTAVPSVFAIGDVTNRVNLTPVAIREGAAFVSTQFEGRPKRFDYHNIPKAVFAQPPVGSVGLTEEECQEKGRLIDIYEADFRAMKNVLARSDERMYMKLIVDQQTNQVIGCHMVGAEAAELMQIVAIAVKAGVTKAQFDETCALHPTVSEEIVTMTTKKETSS